MNAALHLDGRIDEEAIGSFCADGTLLGAHPEHALEGVDFCTGSLGQGLFGRGSGAGREAAEVLAARLRDRQ